MRNYARSSRERVFDNVEMASRTSESDLWTGWENEQIRRIHYFSEQAATMGQMDCVRHKKHFVAEIDGNIQLGRSPWKAATQLDEHVALAQGGEENA